MKQIRLDPRLQSIADQIPQGTTVADIGTDHAYLVGWLVQQNRISAGYACDVNLGPLKTAENLLGEYALLDRVKLVRSDGLQALENLPVDVYIIAGMGGELIATILEKSPWCRNPQKLFFLQPMTKQADLRKYLYAQGFEILEEIPSVSGKHAYSCIKATYCGRIVEISLRFAWFGKIWEQNSPEALEYLRQKQVQLKRMQRSFAEGDGMAQLLCDLNERLENNVSGL